MRKVTPPERGLVEAAFRFFGVSALPRFCDRSVRRSKRSQKRGRAETPKAQYFDAFGSVSWSPSYSIFPTAALVGTPRTSTGMPICDDPWA